MSEIKKQEKNYKLAAATVVAVFCMGQIPGSIDAAISKITNYFHLLGGVLADYGWNYVFLNHLVLIIPFIIVIISCVKLDFNESAKSSPDSDVKGKKEKFSSGVYQIWALMLVVGILIAPLLVGCSFLSEPIDNSASVREL